MKRKEITTRINRVWLEDDGIVRVPGARVTLADAEETMAAYLKLYQGKPRPLFVDTRRMRAFARDARAIYAGEEAARAARAVALIVDTPISRVLGNFYLGVSNPHLPTRLFSSEDEALQWLQGFLA